jgi:DNA-binding response OmpR family regulator
MSSLHHILVVEDDTDIANLVRIHLERAGYQISRAADGKAAVKRFDEGDYDLVILDLMLPLMDGMEVCRHIRNSERYVPVIMLTAKGEEANKVAGLEMGADDYMTKPFSVEELLARVKAIGRRIELVGKATAGRGDEEQVMDFGDLSIDLGKRLALKDGQDLHLTQKEFEILRILALTPGRPYSRRHLCERAGVESFDGTDRTIDTHIKRLRAKLETDRNRPQYVLTVWGYGYKFTDKLC